MRYKKDAAPLRFASPSTVLAVLGALVALLGGALLWLYIALARSGATLAYYISMCALMVMGASVEEGGLPAMLRSAMGTRILFKPTLPEARLLWSADKLEVMLDRGHYNPGEAWFSSTDGVNDNVTFVRFPRLEFPVYAELGRLLRLYGG